MLALDSRHGLWDWNAATREIVLDDNFLEILRYAPGERPSVADVWTDSVHPDDLPLVLDVLNRHIVHGDLYDVG
jgi:PAS fold